MAGLVDHDSEENELLDKNAHVYDWRRAVVVLERLDNLVRRSNETDEAVRHRNQDDEAERAVDGLDEPANPGVIPSPLFQPNEQYAPGGVARE